MKINILKILVDMIFPPLCVSCKKVINNQKEKCLCKKCREEIAIADSFFCPRCGRRLPPTDETKPCHREEKFILASASFYQNKPARELIHALKYQRIKDTAVILEEIISVYINRIEKNYNFSDFIIIPIPLHRKKERRRGFNQADIISNLVKEAIEKQGIKKIRIDNKNLIRIKNSKPQAEIQDYQKRRLNIQDAFLVKNPAVLKNKKIILVDDVFTSGATMKEAVKTLKQIGAGRVIGFVVVKS